MATGADRREQIRPVLEYVDGHAREHITLDDAAAVVHVSPSRIRHVFKDATGICFKEYVTHVRVAEAKRLLLSSDLSVAQVASAVSYSNLHQFYKVFHRLCAMSPAEYRRYYTPAADQPPDGVGGRRASGGDGVSGKVISHERFREHIRAEWETGPRIRIREARYEDWRAAGRICYTAFATLADEHRFEHDFPTVEAASDPIRWMIQHPAFYGVVAEQGDRVVGSSFLDQRGTILAIGPVSVDPRVQNRRVGRLLMEAMFARAAELGAPGVRLLQLSYHNRSLSLYAKLGMEVRGSFAAMFGDPIRLVLPGYMVRDATAADEMACNSLCLRVHGHDARRRSRRGDRRRQRAGGPAARPDNRVYDGHELLRPLGGRDTRRPAGTHRRGRRLRHARLPGPARRHRAVPLVPGARPARLLRAQHDDPGALRGTARRIHAVSRLLTHTARRIYDQSGTRHADSAPGK